MLSARASANSRDGGDVMKYRLKNLTQRPVSIPCNSGGYCHLPPQHEQLLEAVDILDNALVSKLVERGVLSRVEAIEGEARKSARTEVTSARKDGDEVRAENAASRKRTGSG